MFSTRNQRGSPTLKLRATSRRGAQQISNDLSALQHFDAVNPVVGAKFDLKADLFQPFADPYGNPNLARMGISLFPHIGPNALGQMGQINQQIAQFLGQGHAQQQIAAQAFALGQAAAQQAYARGFERGFALAQAQSQFQAQHILPFSNFPLTAAPDAFGLPQLVLPPPPNLGWEVIESNQTHRAPDGDLTGPLATHNAKDTLRDGIQIGITNLIALPWTAADCHLDPNVGGPMKTGTIDALAQRLDRADSAPVTEGPQEILLGSEFQETFERSPPPILEQKIEVPRKRATEAELD